ncbi:hypothetical protein VYU27_003015 [Nannochloropsis oceanica]
MPLLYPAGSVLSRPASPRWLQPHKLARSLCVLLLMYAALLSPLRHQARAFNTLRPLSMSMPAVSTPLAQRLRVVTYNILTPNYATPRDLPAHPAVHLNEQERLQKILTKLKAETVQGSVIALQEISRAWAGHLHVFFAREGYHFVHSGYGRPSSGFMGVGLAWPHSTLKAATVDISRLADAKPWPAPPPPGALTSLSRGLLRPFRRLLGTRGRGNGKDEDVMAAARDRSNTVIMAQLRSKESEGLDFFIACYHMPCEFRRPPIMTVHAALLVQRLQALAQGKPHIVTGDFNFQPTWPQYQLITEGEMPTEHAHYPPMPPTDPWTPRVEQPLKSALKVKWGQEPDFTCHSYADRETGERFCEPLDYIFLSPEWRVVDAVQLQSKKDALNLPCPFPDQDEPSDHVMLWADLSLEK